MTHATEREANTGRSRLGWMLRPYAGRLAVAVVLLFGLTGVNITVPQLIGLVFTELESGTITWALLMGVLTVMLLLFVVRNLLYFYSKYSAVRVGEDVSFELRNRLFERLQQMNLQYYRQNKPGNLSSRVMNDSFTIQTFIQDELPKLAQAVLLFVGIVAAMYATNWQLALAATVILPLHLGAFYYFKGPIKSASRHAQEHMAEATGNLIEKFLGMEVVKGFTAEGRESEAFESAIDASRRSQLKSKKYHVMQKVAADLLIGLGLIGLIGFGAYQVMRGHMEAGYLITFFLYVKEVNPTIVEMMSGFAKLTKATASVDRVNDVLQTPGIESRMSGDRKPAIQGRLVFQNVCFRYPDHPLTLRNISFTVEPGEVCAIVGHSGAGKSTLVNLVPRFHDPESGRLYVDGIDAREFDLRHLRRAIGIAFQECFLFNSTILENLRYARPRATQAQIVEACQRTGANDFIARLPQGYDTLVGEAGVTLSRGQKQLINLTRAMLKNPRILILDEATASIDEAREKQTVQAILEFMHGKTTLMITHRPELLRHADKVLELAEGEVIYFGPPQESPSMIESSSNLSRLPYGDFPQRLDRPEDTDVDDDRPDARPSGSGVWRGIKALALSALVGLGALHGAAAPLAWAQQDQAQEQEQQQQAQQPEENQVQAEAAAQDAEPAAEAAEVAEEGSGSGQFLSMAGLTDLESQELLEIVIARLRAQMGYQTASSELSARLPDAPSQMRQVTALSRRVGEAHHLLQLGYKDYVSQPTHFWLYGQSIVDGRIAPNPEMEQVEALVKMAQDAQADREQGLTTHDLEARRVRLSYVDVGRAMGVLKSFGYQAIEYKSDGNGAGKDEIITPLDVLDPTDLPVVIALPGSKAVDLVGPAQATGRNTPFGLTMSPSVASELPDMTSSGREMELLVLYDPADPATYSRVVERIRNHIDLPAQQVLIEAMVLEVSETGLDKLGVDWNLSTPFNGSNTDNITDLRFGRLPNFSSSNDEQATLGIGIDDVFGHWRVRVEALVREGEAEILSRPSVLTLDNRQASLRVGEEIPIAKTVDVGNGGDAVKLDFAYIPVGILLNLRPRIADLAQEVSMQIDGVVSAQVPGEDLVVRDEEGDELGRAPRISTRRVQTYARVSNNTPFIIGGLISRDDTVQVDKVPLLGDIPLLGYLFRSTQTEKVKREVIIVLTPYVLPENQLAGRNIPKDDDAFDSFDNELFRDAYRIRDEDVFDLTFLTRNPQVRRMQRLADEVVQRNQDLAREYPFNRFANRHIPGEHILVYRQMYEVINRNEIDQQLQDGQIIFFEPDAASESGFSVGFLEPTIEAMAKKHWREAHPDVPARRMPEDPFEMLQQANKAVAISYTRRRQVVHDGGVLDQPVATIKVVDCADGQAWSRLLWEMNQPRENGRPHHTILIREADNLTRLKRALVLKRTVELNATRGSLTLNNFTIGRQLLMPEVEPDKMYLIDTDTARYFFMTEQYYPALQKQLQQDIEAMQEKLQQPEYSRYLRNIGAPRNEED